MDVLKRKNKRFQKNKAILGQAKHRRKRSSQGSNFATPHQQPLKQIEQHLTTITKQRSMKQD
jgi:uncharacterized membrane protein YgaE (UPF0421/DUF939 family)